MPVTTEHPQYTRFKGRWRQVRDCVEGDERIKKRGPAYLPQFVPADETRYNQYKDRAIFVNFTGRTLSSLVGAAFRKQPEPAADVPTGILEFINDLDGRGQSLAQVAKSTISNGLQTGRHGLLVDYPRVEGDLTIEEVAMQGVRPATREYSAENILNWRMDGDKTVLIVLREAIDDTTDIFSTSTLNEYQYRVLRLIDGFYVQELYDNSGNFIESIEPTDSASNRWEIIPFVFFGATNNTPDVDQPPLYDMSVVNIGHYRNSADYEEGVYLHGQPMLHIDIGERANADDWNKLNPNGIQVGARRGITTQGGSANLLQAQANGAAFEAMSHKERQLLLIGARLVQRGGQNETAEAVRANASAENSVLGNLVENAQDAFVQCLEWMARFAGINGDIAVTFNTDFFDREPDPQVIAQMIGLQAAGIIAASDVRGYLRRNNALEDERTEEVMQDEIDSDGP